ncbi:TPA: hypothetical protein HA278_02690 [Candidatus Woesearchaeota archaeon]|nr:hypothetical protein [archaeon]HIJ10941.1 hypothetical protein [Candidatus Woesearchaeota archaeon]|tara:strand:- start:1079 stop:1786 length:708 start_codon:yes stop_codon:yes gene_type:complete
MYEHLLTNPELARLVADVTGDGHLQVKGWRYLTSFVSNEIQETEAFERRSKELFDVIPKRYIDSRKTHKGSGIRYQSFIISKPVALFLCENGVPVGNKTNNPFKVPTWIFNGSPEMKAAYLRGLYDNEGTIYSNKEGNKTRWRIAISMAKNNDILQEGIAFFEQLREMLCEFDIKTSPVCSSKLNVRKDGSTSMYLRIVIERKSFRSFLKHIGFDHPKKREKLLFSVGSVVKRLS